MARPVKLGDVAKVISGFAFKSVQFKQGGNVPVIKIKNIRIGRADMEDSDYVSEDCWSINEKYHVKTGDILISLTGSHMTQPNSVVGRVGIYQEGLPPALLNQRAGKIIPQSDSVDKKYLYYVLLSEDIRREIAQMASGAASQANVSPSQVESVELNLPDIEVQREIAEALSAYDTLIENNNRRIAILEEMAQSLYREWFVKFRFPGHENVKFIDSPLGKIPEGWEVKPLEDVVEAIIDYRGKTPKKLGGDWQDEGVRALSALNVKKGTLVRLEDCKKITPELYDKWMKEKLKRGDILLTSEAPLGECCLLYENSDYCLSQRLFAIRANNNIVSPEYLFLGFFTGRLLAELLMRATGSTVSGIRQAALKEVPILVPSPNIMDEFNAVSDALLEQKHVLWRKNINLIEQRSSVLPKLISGNINI